MATSAQSFSARPPSPQAPAIAERLYSVDLLRGVIMVIMALDHVRDFTSNVRFAPENVALTWPALFFTRWITHFCAPWFCFLAGTGAYLATSRGKSLSHLRGLLVKRGLFLIVFESTFMMVGWTFLPYPLPIALVLWMLGWSMIVLAPLTRLPLKWIAAIGIAMIALHNLTDGIPPAAFGHFAWLWTILHVQGFVGPTPPHLLFGKIPLGLPVAYPLLPWPGVMACGYAFGAVMKKPVVDRRRILLWLGTACIALFIVLRATNIYGNQHTPNFTTNGDFHKQGSAAMTVVAFLDTQKYPPSLDFLLMTLGPGFLALAVFDRLRSGARGLQSRLGRFFLVYGRVPMFYYVLHVFLIHLLAFFLAVATRQPAEWLITGGGPIAGAPPGPYGHGLPVVYATWITAVLLLYLPCRWYMELKRRRHDWWMQYI
jgi:uncharacterized membrane protein